MDEIEIHVYITHSQSKAQNYNIFSHFSLECMNE